MKVFGKAFTFHIGLLLLGTHLMASYVAGWAGYWAGLEEVFPSLLSLIALPIPAVISGIHYEKKAHAQTDIAIKPRFTDVVLIFFIQYVSFISYVSTQNLLLAITLLTAGIGISLLYLKWLWGFEWKTIGYLYFACLTIFGSSLLGFFIYHILFEGERLDLSDILFGMLFMVLCRFTFYIYRRRG